MRWVKAYDAISGKWIVVDSNPAPDRVVAVCESEGVADLFVSAMNTVYGS